MENTNIKYLHCCYSTGTESNKNLQCLFCAMPPEVLVLPHIPVAAAFCRYYEAGVSYKDIQSLLLIYHGVQLSISSLKMKRKRMGLIPRKGQPMSTEQEITDAIVNLLPHIPWTAGYRNVHQTLKHLGYDTRRETVMTLMQQLDAEGVNCRRRRRLQRRRYVSPGPDFTWHVDGYDKLKPYGFAIHGSIDGFSRRIMWLEVNPSNNDPKSVALYYMMCIRQRQGCPHVLTTDPGTENGVMAALQCTFRENDDDDYSGINSHRYVKSTSNQRIESWWSFLRRARMEWWIDFFTNFSASPHFNKDNYLHILSIRYSFMPVLKKQLQSIASRWNQHYISCSPYGKCPSGKPDVLYSLNPSLLHNVSEDDIQDGFQQCQEQTRSGSCDFDAYARNVFEEMEWEDALSHETALEQYMQLKDIAES